MAADPHAASPLLDVEDLAVSFPGPPGQGPARAVDGVSFSMAPGEVLGLVGESGCGKSVTAHAVLGLLAPAARVTRGRIRFRDIDLLSLPERERRRLRGDRMAMVFQDPHTALNPVLTIGRQVAEVYRVHRGMSRTEAWNRAVSDLGRVGIPDAPARAHDHPHRLSGGMKQRVGIAMAVALHPALLIADEPTTALDVTVQAQILDLLRSIRRESSMAVLFIGHDLGVVAEVADRVAVLYAGRIVEEGATEALFARPAHPYTAGLLAALPDPAGGRPRAIPGQVPPPYAYPAGCRYAARCDRADAGCRETSPPLEPHGDRRVACRHPLP